jgi:hypothetical protein
MTSPEEIKSIIDTATSAIKFLEALIPFIKSKWPKKKK